MLHITRRKLLIHIRREKIESSNYTEIINYWPKVDQTGMVSVERCYEHIGPPFGRLGFRLSVSTSGICLVVTNLGEPVSKDIEALPDLMNQLAQVRYVRMAHSPTFLLQ